MITPRRFGSIPGGAEAYCGRGVAWQFKSQYDKAIADFSEGTRHNPRFPGSYAYLARVWSSCPDAKYHDAPKAIASATRACELTSWKVADAVMVLAAAHARAGDFESAVKWVDKALGLCHDENNKILCSQLLASFQAKMPFTDRKQ